MKFTIILKFVTAIFLAISSFLCNGCSERHINMTSSQTGTAFCPSIDNSKISTNLLFENGAKVRVAYDYDGICVIVRGRKLDCSSFHEPGVLSVSIRNEKSTKFWTREVLLPETASMAWGLDDISYFNCQLNRQESRKILMVTYACGYGTGRIIQTPFVLAAYEILDGDICLLLHTDIGDGAYGVGLVRYSKSFFDISLSDNVVRLTIFDRDSKGNVNQTRIYVLKEKGFVLQK